MRLIEKVWFFQHPAKWLLVPLLLPLTLLFAVVSLFRRFAYQLGWFRMVQTELPVVIVGNIGIGGNGKTPLTLFLIEQLSKRGLRVGVISRGYGAKAPHYPYQVTESSSAEHAGDEPLLIKLRSKVPVVIGGDRIASSACLAEQGCDIILADDGLQHYRLARAFEFIVIDGKRLFGNGLLLPAGPLREPVSRIHSADAIVINGENQQLLTTSVPIANMQLKAQDVINVATGQCLPISAFIGTYLPDNKSVNALAGIGDPSRFFTTLKHCGFRLAKTKAFVDHQAFSAKDLKEFSQDVPLLMTEKDAVKCREFAQKNYWYLPVDADFTQSTSAQTMIEIIDNIEQLVKR